MTCDSGRATPKSGPHQDFFDDLNHHQLNKIFDCIREALSTNELLDHDEELNHDVYQKTMEILSPQLSDIELNQEPPFDVVNKIWLNFGKTGLNISQNYDSHQRVICSDSLNDDQDSQLSEDSSGQENEEFLPRNLERQRLPKEPKESSGNFSSYALLILLIPFCIFICQSSIFAHENSTVLDQTKSIRINFEKINAISKDYSHLLDKKMINIIRAQATVMQDEISVILLLGRELDRSCKRDATHCIGKAIANLTDRPYGYLDATDQNLNFKSITDELSASFIEGQRHSVLFENLERLKSCDIMSLFQFIDKDETNKRRGMLIFTVYLGDENHEQKQRSSDLVERALLDRWSSCVPYDTLTSVISRITGSIIKTY